MEVLVRYTTILETAYNLRVSDTGDGDIANSVTIENAECRLKKSIATWRKMERRYRLWPA